MAWRKAVVLLACFAAVVLAQGDGTVSIVRFGGVQTGVNPVLLGIDQNGMASASLAVNWDMSMSVGALVKRQGYGNFTIGITGNTQSGEWCGLRTYVDRLGRKRVFGVFLYDSNTTTFRSYPYAFVLSTAANGQNMAATNAYPFQYKAVPYTTIYSDVMVWANGKNPVLRYNGSNLRPLFETPPGSWDVAPMKETVTTVQVLDGDYWYGVQAGRMTDTSHYFGKFADSMNLSLMARPLRVDDDWAVIYSPEIPCTTRGNAHDSTILRFGRTRAGRLESDSMFLVKTLRWNHDSALSITTHWIDSLPDCSLGAGTHKFIGFVDTIVRVADTTSDSTYRLGAPTWLDSDTAASLLFVGISDNERRDTANEYWTHTRYVVAYYDSSTGATSEPSPPVKIPVYANNAPGDSTLRDSSITIGLPKTGINKAHLWRLLARAQESERRIKVPDSSAYLYAVPATPKDGKQPRTGAGGVNLNNYYCPPLLSPGTGAASATEGALVSIGGEAYCEYTVWQRFDTIAFYHSVGRYYVVDTVKDSSSVIYTDDMSWTELSGKPLLGNGTAFRPMNYPVLFHDRIFMADGSRLYYSNPGEPGQFQPENALTIDEDDGDEITALHASEDYVDVFKHNAWYRVREAEPGVFAYDVVKRGMGCIAPGSVIDVPGAGMAFLYLNGIYMFTPAIMMDMKETGGMLPPAISRPIQNNLDKYTLAHKSECWAFMTPDNKNLCFSFPSLDTTWVDSLTSGEWNAWTFAPLQTAYYDTVSRPNPEPISQLLFINQVNRLATGVDAGDTIFKYGSVKTDKGDSVTAAWRSNLLFVSPGYGSIDRLGLWKETADTGNAATITYRLYDEEGAQLQEKAVRDSTNQRYRLDQMKPGWAHGFKIQIETKVDSLAVERLDVLWRPVAQDKEH